MLYYLLIFNLSLHQSVFHFNLKNLTVSCPQAIPTLRPNTSPEYHREHDFVCHTLSASIHKNLCQTNWNPIPSHPIAPHTQLTPVISALPKRVLRKYGSYDLCSFQITLLTDKFHISSITPRENVRPRDLLLYLWPQPHSTLVLLSLRA